MIKLFSLFFVLPVVAWSHLNINILRIAACFLCFYSWCTIDFTFLDYIVFCVGRKESSCRFYKMGCVCAWYFVVWFQLKYFKVCMWSWHIIVTHDVYSMNEQQIFFFLNQVGMCSTYLCMQLHLKLQWANCLTFVRIFNIFFFTFPIVFFSMEGRILCDTINTISRPILGTFLFECDI